MSRVDDGGVWKLCKFSQAADDLEHAATREIGSPDASLKEGIAREENILFRTIEGNRTARMSGRTDNPESMCSEGYFLVFSEIQLAGGESVV